MSYHTLVFLGAACLLVPGLPARGQDAEQEAKQLAQKAQELGQAQKFDEAITAMKKAVQLAPRNDLYLAMTSDYEFKAGRFADGLEHALQALKLNDKIGQYYVLVASNAIGAQDLDRAREYCETILKREKEFGTGPANDARILMDRVQKKTYTLLYNLDPQRVRYTGGTLAVALPRDNLPYQSVTYEITGVKSHRLVKGEANDVLHVVPQGNRSFPLTVRVTVQPYTFKKELEKATAGTLPAEARAHLGPIVTINPKSPALTKIAAGLKGSNNVETARNVLAWMKKNIEYKLESSKIGELDFKTVDDIVQRGHAECRGYAMLFTALCKAADVPARPMWGLIRVAPGQDRRFGDIASHNWAEFYAPGCGWVPVDPQRPETLGCLPTSCIRIFMDAKKTKTSLEGVPMLNLLIMNGDKLKFEESRGETSRP